MRKAYSFYIIFQVLKVLLIKIWKIQQPDLLFLVVFISFHISIIIFQTFLELHSTLSEKKIFITNFPFSTDWLNPPPLPAPLRPKSAKCDESFLSMLPYKASCYAFATLLSCMLLCFSLAILRLPTVFAMAVCQADLLSEWIC